MFYLLVLVCALAPVFGQEQTLQVNITQGIVQGSIAPDGIYYTFYGVHYAGAPVGQNRFKAPTPAPSYPGVLIAHDRDVICAQPSSRGLVGTEDCLVLNIFTNATTPAKPVLVWLIGEEYTNTEQTARSFRRLVQEGVVIVELNYRVSIFGFLCLRTPEAPGNAGLKDVVQGLKWIKENIAAFGGDPNNVILFGHGSGAAMVDLITMSPSANGLVHKAIAQSGSALAPWAVSYDPIGYAQEFGSKLGYTGKTNAELAQLLVTTDVSLLIPAMNDFEFYNNTILFAPCIEDPNLNSNETFLTAAPSDILKSRNYSHIPYIAGYTDREGTIRAQQAAYGNWLDKMETNFTLFLQADLDLGNNASAVEKSIREFYFSQRTINMETIEDYLDYQGDTLILVSVIRGARERALTSRAEVRLFEFGYRGTQNSDWAYQTIPLTGARHGSVLNFLLDYDLRPMDEPVMTSLINRYVAFFNTGVPNATWLPITGNSLQYMLYSGSDGPQPLTALFREEPRVNPHTQRMDFWNNLYSKYYVPPKFTNSGENLVGVTLILFVSQLLTRLF
ncbi:venom carboxylesterase-6-like [Pectinophora gossypiella]|uniref:venom carboxylesterase-6-like n=1 Tax=Pectinophora gossypiella TaxID=13191 RepID=UPI00214F16DD|nr:venom carboxylesterase-6-like [Pectinophora gossypiella]